MENKITLPIGMSNFTEIRKNHYYYIDKTGLIKNLLQNNLSKGTLITRPRRFGKTLAMCMLADFFDIRKDSRALFDGLYIVNITVRQSRQSGVTRIFRNYCILRS